MTSAYETALDRINKDLTAKELELSELGLKEIPEEIGKLTNLRELYIRDNQMTDMTLAKHLTQLEKLIIGTSGFGQSHGDEANEVILDVSPLAELKNLTYLDISEKQIEIDTTQDFVLGELEDLSEINSGMSDLVKDLRDASLERNRLLKAIKDK